MISSFLGWGACLFISNKLAEKYLGFSSKSEKFPANPSFIPINVDKKVMSYVTSSQLQFWFMLFMMVIYWIILLFKEKEFKIKNNYCILLTAIFLTIGDRCLFIANSFPQSKVWFMTILKQLSVIVSVILGKVIFKEKNIIKKIICSLIIILGVMLMFI